MEEQTDEVVKVIPQEHVQRTVDHHSDLTVPRPGTSASDFGRVRRGVMLVQPG